MSCPLNQLLFADDVAKQCVKICSDFSYADKKSVKCVGTCPTTRQFIIKRCANNLKDKYKFGIIFVMVMTCHVYYSWCFTKLNSNLCCRL